MKKIIFITLFSVIFILVNTFVLPFIKNLTNLENFLAAFSIIGFCLLFLSKKFIIGIITQLTILIGLIGLAAIENVQIIFGSIDLKNITNPMTTILLSLFIVTVIFSFVVKSEHKKIPWNWISAVLMLFIGIVVIIFELSNIAVINLKFCSWTTPTRIKVAITVLLNIGIFLIIRKKTNDLVIATDIHYSER